MEKELKVKKQDIEDIYTLTPLQEGMLFQYLRNQGSEEYFEELILEIEGKIDQSFLKQAWGILVEDNEALRTLFRWEKIVEPIQVVLKKYNLDFNYFDLVGEKSEAKKKRLGEIKSENREKKIDLREIPFRVILLRVEETSYEMIVNYHHILFDGWSMGIILREFFEAYNIISNHLKVEKRTKTKFKEYIKWIKEKDKKGEEWFWKEYLHGLEAPAVFPLKRIRRDSINLKKRKTAQEHFTIEEEKSNRLKILLAKYQITLATFIYSALSLLIQISN